jgi:hypothetical protein
MCSFVEDSARQALTALDAVFSAQVPQNAKPRRSPAPKNEVPITAAPPKKGAGVRKAPLPPKDKPTKVTSTPKKTPTKKAVGKTKGRLQKASGRLISPLFTARSHNTFPSSPDFLNAPLSLLDRMTCLEPQSTRREELVLKHLSSAQTHLTHATNLRKEALTHLDGAHRPTNSLHYKAAVALVQHRNSQFEAATAKLHTLCLR